MYRITYLRMTACGPKIITVSHPSLDVVQDLHDALKLSGVHVRLWGKNNDIMKPPQNLPEIPGTDFSSLPPFREGGIL